MSQLSEPDNGAVMPAGAVKPTPDREMAPLTLPREAGAQPGLETGTIPRWLTSEMRLWQFAPAVLLILWVLVALLRAM